MTEKERKAISSLMDAEISAEKSREVFTEIMQNQDLTAVWQRYHLISDAIRRQLPKSVSMSLPDQISDALGKDANKK